LYDYPKHIPSQNTSMHNLNFIYYKMDKNLFDLLVAISIVIISTLLIILVIVLLNKQAEDNKSVINLQRRSNTSDTHRNIDAIIEVLKMLETKKEVNNVRREISLLTTLINQPPTDTCPAVDVMDFTIPIVILSFICIILLSSFLFFTYKVLNIVALPSFSLAQTTPTTADDITTVSMFDSYESY
jgi:hypothetical protein